MSKKEKVIKKTKKTEEIDNFFQKGKSYHLQKPGNYNRKLILTIIIIAIIIGLIGGALGGFFVLVNRKIKLPFGKEFNLDEYLPKREITIETTKNVTVTNDIQINDLAKDIRPQLVDIFIQKEPDQDVLKQIYSSEEILGKGFILTSDGWLITTRDVIQLKKDQKSVAMTADGVVYPIEKILYDPLTNIIFLKINAKNLSVVKLAEKENVTPGQEVLLFSDKKIIKSTISQLNYYFIKETKDLVKNAEKFSDFILLTKESETLPKATPVINLSGAIIGLVKENNLVIPSFYLRNLITQVLKEGEGLKDTGYLKRPYLGVDYIDLAKFKGIYDNRFKNLSSGALVYGSPSSVSPAYLAGIKNADVILKVNDEPVNERYNLSELIWQYEPESTLEIIVLRAGKEEKIKVVLGEARGE